MTFYLPDFAHIPLTADTDSVAAHCLADPSIRWNGWACPIFPLSSVRGLVMQTAALAAEYGEDSTELVVLVDTDDLNVPLVFTYNPEYAEEYEDPRGEPVHPITVAGTPYWPVGSHAWTWSLRSEH